MAYRNWPVKVLKFSKTNHYSNFFETHKNDLKKVWNGIREVISGKSNSKNEVPKLLIDKNNHYDKDPDIANTFNNFYGSVANKTKSKIVPTNTKPKQKPKLNVSTTN